MNTQLQRSSLVARIAMVIAFTLVLGTTTVFAAKKPGGGGGGNTTTKPPTPTNFRVTGVTAYTISVAWDVAGTTADFNFYLSGAYGVTPAILPKTARSHTFTALAPG